MRYFSALVLILLFFTLPPTRAAGQPSPNGQVIDAFNQMYWCYMGKRDSTDLTEEEFETFFKQSKLEFSRLKTQVSSKYPVFVYLYEHMRTALEGNTVLSCRHLRDALTEFEKIDKLPLQQAKAKRKTYKDTFGIDKDFIIRFYQSETARSLGLVQGQDCSGKDTGARNDPEPESRQEPAPRPEKAPETPREGPIEKLEKLLSRGLIDSFIEIRQLVQGDGRIIPGENGVPYDVKFKNAKTLEVLFFAGGEYVIEDDSDVKHGDQSRWKAFSPAIQTFSELVIGIMQDYGNSAYHVFVQGSADSVTFRPKPFHPLYDDPSFHTIPLLKVDRQRHAVKKDTVVIGNTIINPFLPQLRAAFVKSCLLFNHRLKTRPDKVTIVEGSVKPIRDLQKRNCSIIIYIDWEEAKKNQRQPTKK